jgi:hypothetical protein
VTEFPKMWRRAVVSAFEAMVGAKAHAKLAGIAARARKERAKAAGHRPKETWKPPRLSTPRELIGREASASRTRLNEPVHSAFYRLSKH